MTLEQATKERVKRAMKDAVVGLATRLHRHGNDLNEVELEEQREEVREEVERAAQTVEPTLRIAEVVMEEGASVAGAAGST